MGQLQFIFGGAGTGKTGYILDDIARAASSERIIYLVPEQFSLQSEKNLIARLGTGAALHAQVLSFRRLAYHVFSETGGGAYFDDLGKAMLLRKLLYERRSELRFFTRASDKQGFMEQLADMVGEFYRYGVTAEKLGAWASQATSESLRDKLSDLSLIYADYAAYVESRYIPTDAMLDALAARIDGSALVRGAVVWLSGFYGFTPQEYKVLAGLLRNAARVTAALTVKADEQDVAQRTDSTDPFYETKRTADKLTALATQCGARVMPPVFLDGGGVNTPAALKFFEQNYLLRAPGVYPAAPDCLFVRCAQDRFGEIHRVAAEITELVRDGYSYGDIAVLTGDIAACERDIRTIFGLYDIPVFIDAKSALPEHPLVEMILAMLDIPVCNWSYESVFRFLKTGMTGLSDDEIDVLENYVLAYGIKGGRWSQERWVHGFDGGLYDADTIHRLKDRIREALAPVNSRGKHAVRTLSADVFAILGHLGVTGTLDRLTAEAEQRGDRETVRRNSQIWAKVCEVFDALVGVMGDERVTVSEFVKILEAGFRVSDMGIIPTAQMQVLAGDIERSRLPAVKALFVIGVNEGLLPAVGETPSLLDDHERRLLDPAAEQLAPGGRRRAYEQQFLIYQALSTPTERVYLSYSRGGTDGRALRPSTLIAAVKRMYPLLAEDEADDPTRVLPAKPMFAQMGAALRDFLHTGAADGLLPKVYAWFAQESRYAPQLAAMRDILFAETGGERLSEQSTGRLYGQNVTLSASRLERYVQCPFAYFIRHNLGALERKVYEVLAPDLGSLYHDTLEMFTKKYEARSWRTLDRDEIDQGVDECVAALAPRLGSEVLLSTARYQYVQRQAARVLKRSIWALSEHIKSGAFEIFATELGFGVDCPVREVVLTLADGRRMTLHGRIDRVDIMDFDGKQYIKIIDYKSGHNKFDRSEVYFGMQIQLLLYMEAFIRGGAQAEPRPGGVFYFHLDDPTVDFSEKTLEALDDEILGRFKMSGLVMADADIIRALDAGAGRSSKIIPAAINAKGEASGASVATLAEFNALRAQVVETIKQIGERMTAGEISILPYKKGPATGCDYCLYGGVCRFQDGKYQNVKSLEDAALQAAR